jgi:membrane protease YdiL (CAAX protease family)
VLLLAAFLVLQIAVAQALGLLAFLGGDDWFRAGGLAASNEIFLLLVALSIPPTVGATFLFVRFLDGRTLSSLGARWPRGGRRAALRQLITVPLGTLAFLGGWLALLLVLPDSLAAVRCAGLSPAYESGPAWWPLSPGLLLLVLLLGFLLQAGLEEWVVRGYVYRALKDAWRPFTSAVVSSLAFALLHAANPEISWLSLLNIVLAGMILAALVERSGSLWSATLAHGAWNFSVACLLSLPISGVRIFHLLEVTVAGDERLTGGAFGPEASLLLTCMGLLLTAALWWRRTAPSTAEDGPGSPSPEESMV